MIVIFGATGNTGSVAARELLGKGSRLRVVGRSRQRLASLEKHGAQAVEADLEDGASVRRALEGAEAAYVLIPPNFAAADFRAYQDRVARIIGDAVEASGCPRVVMLSSLGAQHSQGTGPIVGLYQLEKTLRALESVEVLAIRAGYFMENFLTDVGAVKEQGVLAAPGPADAPLSLIAAADIGAYAAQRLGSLDFQGFEVVNLVGPRPVTFGELTAIIGKAIGKPDLPFTQLSYEDAQRGMVAGGVPAELAKLYIELYQGAARGLLAPEEGTPVVQTPTPVERFADTFAEAYRGA